MAKDKNVGVDPFEKFVLELLENATGAPPASARRKMSLNDIADKFSQQIDNVIIQNRNQGLSFHAGRFKISAVNEKNFTVSYELYFKDDANKWKIIEDCSPPKNSADWLSNDAWLELKSINEKIFEIEEPT